MTIVSGLICKDAIVMASDSQTTFGVPKDIQSQKIFIVDFANAKSLVGISGSAEMASCAMDRLVEKAKTTKIVNQFTVSDLLRECVGKVVSDLKQTHMAPQYSLDDLHTFLENNWSFALMVAHYCKGVPVLHTINSGLCVANKINSHCGAIGCGGDLGMYLLKEYSQPKMEVKHGMATCMYVVEQVKKHVSGCEGQTQVGLLLPQDKMTVMSVEDGKLREAHIVNRKRIERIVAELSRLDDTTKAERNKAVLDMVERVAKEDILAFVTELQKIIKEEGERDGISEHGSGFRFPVP